MSTVIGRTEDGREILRHAPEEGCRWRCETCGCPLRGRREVRGHWALHSQEHGMFRHLTTEETHHQKAEGQLTLRGHAPR